MAVLQEQPYSPKASWVNQPQGTQQVYNTLSSYQNTMNKQIKKKQNKQTKKDLA